MSILRLLSGLSLLMVLFSGCEDAFNPKMPYHQVPVLYCILNADYQHVPGPQRAVISATYDVPGVDPSVNHTDPGITGATVILQVHDRQYTLVETKTARRDTSRYTDSLVSYAHQKVLLFPYDTVTLSAVLPDGRTLWARSSVPSPKGIATRPEIPPMGFTTQVNRFEEGSFLVMDWDAGGADEHLYFPKLMIGYTVRTMFGDSYRNTEVPLRFVQSDGARVPVYPSPQIDKVCAFELDAIDEFMRNISGGDSLKKNYAVNGMVFTLTEFDFPLSRFYASVNGYLDQYSVRIDESTYTDVVGGIGVFGVRMDSRWTFPLAKRYIRSFGYEAPD